MRSPKPDPGKEAMTDLRKCNGETYRESVFRLTRTQVFAGNLTEYTDGKTLFVPGPVRDGCQDHWICPACFAVNKDEFGWIEAPGDSQ